MLFALGSGFKVILCVPANVCPERIKLLKLFGVKLMVTISCYSQFRNNIELLYYENLRYYPSNKALWMKSTILSCRAPFLSSRAIARHPPLRSG